MSDSGEEISSDIDVIHQRKGKIISTALLLTTLIIAVCVILINCGVLLRIIKIIKRCRDTKPSFFFIGNMALSDMAIGFYVLIIFAINLAKKTDLWQYSLCGLQIMTATTLCQETILTIMMISIDKYVYICHGLYYKNIITRKRVYISIIFSWIFSIIIGLLPVIGMKEHDRPGGCSFPLYINKDFSILLFLTSVVIPLSVIVSLYAILLTLAIKMVKSRYGSSDSQSTGSATTIRMSSLSKGSKLSTKSTSSKNSKKNPKKMQKLLEKYQTQDEILKKPNPQKDEESVRQIKGDVRQNKNHQPESETDFIRYDKIARSNRIERYNENNGEASEPFLMKKSNNKHVDQPDETSTLQVDTIHTKNNPNFRKYQADYESKTCKPLLRENMNLNTTKMVDNTDIKQPKKQEIAEDLKQTNLNSPPDLGNDVKHTHDTNHTKGEPKAEFISKSNYFKSLFENSKDKVAFFKKCRAVKTVVLIVGSFFLTYVPFVLGTLVYKCSYDHTEDLSLLDFLNRLLFCGVIANSLANPFIYAYGYKEFRIKTEKFKGICARET